MSGLLDEKRLAPAANEVLPRLLEVVSAEAILAAQKRSMELVLRKAPLEEVLAELARIVEDFGSGGTRAAIVIVDLQGRFRAAAAPHLPRAFTSTIEKSSAADLGALGLAATSGVTTVSQDIAADPHWGALHALAEHQGLKAAWCHPIVSHENRILGTFGTFFCERRRPSALELRLVETLSQTAALVITRYEFESVIARQRSTLDLAMEAAQMGAWRYTTADNICLYDERAQRLYGLSDGRFLHDQAGVERMIYPDDQARMWAAVAVACNPTGEGRYDTEYRVRQPDGSWRWLSAWGLVEFEDTGDTRRPIAITGASRDISSLKRAEEHQRMLVNELSHRVKNTLATVHSIASHTLRNTGDVETLRRTLEDRILSLARAQDILTDQNWEGADLADVVSRSIEPFAGPRFHISGGSLRVSPKHALALAMAFHELATNAAKYGALAASTGRVYLAWTARDGMLTLIWREAGGSRVTVPTRSGFGSKLLSHGAARDLGGTAHLDFAPAGVVWTITVPLEEDRIPAPTI